MKSLNTLFTRGQRVVAALAAIVLVTLSGCDRILDQLPTDRFTPAAAFSSPQNIELAVLGLYDAAQSGIYDPAGSGNPPFAVRGYPFGAFKLQAADVRGEDIVNTQVFFGIIGTNIQNPGSPNVVGYYQSMYRLINYANVLIDNIQTFGASVPGAQAFIAEARFLRAIAHHELVVHWARPYWHTQNQSHLGVILRTSPISSIAATQAAFSQNRSTVAEVYNQILADLNFCETNLPPSYTNAKFNITRATRKAAIAYKSIIYMHMHDWANVLVECNKLLPAAGTTTIAGFTAPNPTTTGATRLATTPAAVFAGNDQDIENIFSIEHASTDNASVNGSLSTFYIGTGSFGNGRGILAISPEFYNNSTLWDCADLRRTSLTGLFTHAGAGGSAVFLTKYTDVVNLGDYAPIVRYSEVMLNAAEALVRQPANLAGTAPARAIEIVNVIRARAGLAAYAGATTNDAVLREIWNQRRIEFLGEGRRWLDTHRNLKVPAANASETAVLDCETGSAPFLGGQFAVARRLANTQTSGARYSAPGSLGACGTTFAFPFPSAYSPTDNLPYSDFRVLWPIPAPEIAQLPILTQNPGY